MRSIKFLKLNLTNVGMHDNKHVKTPQQSGLNKNYYEVFHGIRMKILP